jgi:hypothetical protein
LKRFVRVVRQHVEPPRVIERQAVVTGPHPVAVTVDQRHLQCQKPQRFVNVEQWGESGFQLLGGGVVQHPAEFDQPLPAFGGVF